MELFLLVLLALANLLQAAPPTPGSRSDDSLSQNATLAGRSPADLTPWTVNDESGCDDDCVPGAYECTQNTGSKTEGIKVCDVGETWQVRT
jgi:hypothetical protein